MGDYGHVMATEAFGAFSKAKTTYFIEEKYKNWIFPCY